jgi:tetratricopeptide (TPR) repeat protein
LAEVILKRWPKSATADQTRLLMAKLALMGERWDEVVSLASAVASDPSLQAQGTALAGIARWREVNRLAEDVPSRAEKLSQAVAFLRQSSKVWADVPSTTPAGLTPDRWRMEIVRGEVELAAGSADQATSVVEVLTRALEDQEHRPTDPALLASAVAVVMRIRLAQGKVDDAKAFFASVSPLLEKGESKGVTGALLTLVRSVRASQSPSSGPSVRPSVEIKGLETLLDEVSQRQQDLSPREKLYLVDAYLAAGNGAKALALVDPLLPNLPAAEQVTPRLLRAKALSLTNRHEEALADITQLLRENVGVKEVIVARGEILESAGDGVAAIKHWQWYLDRLKRVEPRPAELYEVTDRICGLALSVGVAAPETKKVLAGSLRLPIYLLETDPNMPAEWKNRLSRRVDEIKRRLAGGSSS